MRLRPVFLFLFCILFSLTQDLVAANSRKHLSTSKARHAQVRKAQRAAKKSRSGRAAKVSHKTKSLRAGGGKRQAKRAKSGKYRSRRSVTLNVPVAPPVFPDSLRNALVKSEVNRIIGAEGFSELKKKLEHGGRVRIVHLGDSHIQADMMTRVIRRGLQARYGNAGRGLVFPYQLAATNSPRDVMASSSCTWSSSRLPKPSSGLECGISGFVLHTDASNTEMELWLRPSGDTVETFRQVRLFASGTGCVTASATKGASDPDCLDEDELSGRKSIELPFETERLFISASAERESGFTLYGLSLEKGDVPGVIYDAIGVNGADYESYRRCETFWAQIGALQADCYIVSLGTNDAQNLQMKPELFADQVRAVVRRLRKVSPKALIVLATPPPSYYRQLRFNAMLDTVSETIRQVSSGENVACWDMYHASLGESGADLLRGYAFYRPDLVHFSRQGYELQGEMLLDAMVRQLEQEKE